MVWVVALSGNKTMAEIRVMTEPNRLMAPEDWVEANEDIRKNFWSAVTLELHTREFLRILRMQKLFCKINAIHEIKTQPFFGDWPWPKTYGGTIKIRRPVKYIPVCDQTPQGKQRLQIE